MLQNNMPDTQGIQISTQNPFYWQYQGKPILLLGGSLEDNLFQIANLKAHLELLHSICGNYIRCTMSSRDEGDVKPYCKGDDGRFDLEKFNPEYWQKFSDLLRWCHELDIIVQIEVWATYDFYWGAANWADNPFNPKINVNYTAVESGLPEEIDYPAQTKVNPFFKSVPALDNNEFLLAYQQKFVDKLLSISLPHDNVLYCSDNETLAPYPWGQYWAKYLHTAVEKFGKKIFVTEMWDYWDPSSGEVAGAIGQSPALGDWFEEHTNPELHEAANFSYSLNDTSSYQFVDVSNHNAQKGEIHAKTAEWIREAVLATRKIRPINNVKIYGGELEDSIWAGSPQDAKERFWRNIFAGHATVRFHRPVAGIGLSESAQSFIKSLRMFTDRVDFFNFTPANHLLYDRQPNEAFCMMNDRGEYLLYFPTGGETELQAKTGTYQLEKLHIPTSTWSPAETTELPGLIQTDSDDHWGLILRKIS